MGGVVCQEWSRQPELRDPAPPGMASPHLRHPGTASERSEGRRIRDPCLGRRRKAGRCRMKRPVRNDTVETMVCASPAPDRRAWTPRHGSRIRAASLRSAARFGMTKSAGRTRSVAGPGHLPSSSRNGVRAKRRTTYPGSLPRPTSKGRTVQDEAAVRNDAAEVAPACPTQAHPSFFQPNRSPWHNRERHGRSIIGTLPLASLRACPPSGR